MAGHYSIVLADAHTQFRRELRKILEEHQGIKVVGEAGNRHELFALLKQAPSAMVIMDISMPDLRAREGIHLIKFHYPHVKILVMVMDQDPEYLSFGLAAGAQGVLTKQYVAGQVFKAIAAVRRGKLYIPSGFSVEPRPRLRTLMREEQMEA
ncbi:MAG: response regulator transcription factor [Deltaproteobacteria bacterium]|jgi:DNA-binding NarL/FixJ family response regulator